MPIRRDFLRPHVALVTAFSLVGPPNVALVRVAAQATAQAPKTPTPPPKAPAAPAAKSQPAPAAPATPQLIVDGDWPRAYKTATGGEILLYQPQVASWTAQRHMEAYGAVSYQAKSGDKPALGSIKIEADTRVALEERLVSFQPLKITEANFPTLQKEQIRDITAEIDKALPPDERVIALDRVLASVDHSQIVPKNVDTVKADPPPVYFSKVPAVMVNLDGEPIWSPIEGNDLRFAVNTNWDLFQIEATKTFYLRNEASWLKATDIRGPWTPAGTLPASFSKLPADENWKDVKAAVPGKNVSAKQVPTVFVSLSPAELILLTGEPSYVAVADTKLLWVNNTESDVFRMGRTGPVYFLVAGRWFSAPDFGGPWTFATPSLPAEFQKIPLEHARSRVLASVPGTREAAEAVLLAQVPQTARVNRKELKAPEVVYQGNPQFAAIEQTSLQRAVNTDKDIIKVGDAYYMCYQGVWFTSKSPTGPWEVANTVPASIYQIPVSSPVHNVTYVTIEDDDDDDWVVFAAAAGYTGMMVAWGCAVWGTGYYYPPYWGYGGFYPYYYPHFPTYGYGAYYNPWTGAYGRTAVAYGPYGGAGVTARYNPRTGTYSRGAAAWGPYGARGYAQAYNPRTGAYGATRQGSNPYGSWGSTAVQRGDDWARTSRVTNNRTGTTTRVTRGDDGAAAATRRGPQGTGGAVRTEGGDVYAGRDGNVYKRNDGGGWDKYDGGGNWNTADRPQPRDGGTARTGERAGTTSIDPATRSQIDRDAAARAQGAERTRDYGTYQRSGGSTRSAGTYRPSGGGMRGGGGRRR